jgi:hypothetical protein
MQFAYCAARDRDAAATTEHGDWWREFYRRRAGLYDSRTS